MSMQKYREKSPYQYAACLLVLLMASSLATGCKTTSPHQGAYVDTEKSELTVYSTSDRRTFFAGETNTAELQMMANALKAHLRIHRNDTHQDLTAMNNLARVEVALGELDAAEKNCRAVLRVDLKNAEARKTLAEIAIRRGQFDLASIYLASIGGTHSQDSTVINMLAMIELAHGRNSAAMALFKKAIKLDGNDLAARMNLGVLYVKHRMLPDAAVQFERVLKVSPNHGDAAAHLAVVKASRGEVDQARKMLEDVLDRDQSNPVAHYNLAVILKGQNDYEDAVLHLKKVAKSNRATHDDQSQALALMEDIQRTIVAKNGKGDDAEASQQEMDTQSGGADHGRPKVAATQRDETSPAEKEDKKAEAKNKEASLQGNATKKPAKKSVLESDDQQDLEQAIK
jgi:Flp pilus assembly protein TadD